MTHRKEHIPLPFYRPNLEETIGKMNTISVSRTVSQYIQISHRPSRSRKNHIHVSLWNVRLSSHGLFGLSNAPGHNPNVFVWLSSDMIEKRWKFFIDDILVLREIHVRKLATPICTESIKTCEDTNLSLNWEKSHFMVKEGIVLGHKISKNGIEVHKAKVDVIAKLPHPHHQQRIP
ncbi:hypothetical protein Tco_0542334 [Tanacetum coccineum]